MSHESTISEKPNTGTAETEADVIETIRSLFDPEVNVNEPQPGLTGDGISATTPPPRLVCINVDDQRADPTPRQSVKRTNQHGETDDEAEEIDPDTVDDSIDNVSTEIENDRVDSRLEAELIQAAKEPDDSSQVDIEYPTGVSDEAIVSPRIERVMEELESEIETNNQRPRRDAPRSMFKPTFGAASKWTDGESKAKANLCFVNSIEANGLSYAIDNDGPNDEFNMIKTQTLLYADTRYKPTPAAIAMASRALTITVDDGFMATGFPTPKKVSEATHGEFSQEWIKSIETEWNQLIDKETWHYIDYKDIPNGSNIMTSGFVFRVKLTKDNLVDKFKTRLIAKGFTQIEGVDFFDTYAPVARPETIRSVVAFYNRMGWEPEHWDFDGAYVQGPMDCDCYMQIPAGIMGSGFNLTGGDPPSEYVKLERGLYGTRQGGRIWHDLSTDKIEKVGYKRSTADPCLWVYHNGSDWSIIVIYVDDLLIGSSSQAINDWVYKELSKDLTIGAREKLTWHLGVSYEWDKENGTVTLSQKGHIKKLLEAHNMSDCYPVSTPCSDYKLGTADCPTPEQITPEILKMQAEYRSGVASSLWIARNTRPDIAYATSRLGRYSNNPGVKMFEELKRLLRYLQGTMELGIRFTSDKNDIVPIVHADADYNNDVDTRRSHTGYVALFQGGPVSWTSNLQQSVTLSTTEAELVALSKATQEAIYLRHIFCDIYGVQYDAMTDAAPIYYRNKREWDPTKPLQVYCDNLGTVHIVKNPAQTARLKHVATREFFARENIASGEIDVIKIGTKFNAADTMTKAAPRELVWRHRPLLMGMELDNMSKRKLKKDARITRALNARLVSADISNEEVNTESIFETTKSNAKYALAYISSCMKAISPYGYKVTREVDSITNPYAKVNDSSNGFSKGEMAWMDYLNDKPRAHKSKKRKVLDWKK